MHIFARWICRLNISVFPNMTFYLFLFPFSFRLPFSNVCCFSIRCVWVSFFLLHASNCISMFVWCSLFFLFYFTSSHSFLEINFNFQVAQFIIYLSRKRIRVILKYHMWTCSHAQKCWFTIFAFRTNQECVHIYFDVEMEWKKREKNHIISLLCAVHFSWLSAIQQLSTQFRFQLLNMNRTILDIARLLYILRENPKRKMRMI